MHGPEGSKSRGLEMGKGESRSGSWKGDHGVDHVGLWMSGEFKSFILFFVVLGIEPGVSCVLQSFLRCSGKVLQDMLKGTSGFFWRGHLT